jgi:hypothetical protein
MNPLDDPGHGWLPEAGEDAELATNHSRSWIAVRVRPGRSRWPSRCTLALGVGKSTGHVTPPELRAGCVPNHKSVVD